ncbi:MAG: hypothetical protein IJC41_04175 [Firmicutes bacterium]|nr:hypothetical protein [Clostridiales bacterium]MBQ4340178.1 hypothetical protein [Bacillota bacterium]MBR6700296.1 hypothetical protein [Bacillota bacterium]
MREQQWNNEYRLTTVCIDSYEDSQMVGRFYNPYLNEGISFKSLSQFLIQMENLLDNMNLPQSFTALRSFPTLPARRQHDLTSGDTELIKGMLTTFTVRVIFRQHTSWQGSVVWLDQGTEQSFRSVLELILLMDSALCTAMTNKLTTAANHKPQSLV